MRLNALALSLYMCVGVRCDQMRVCVSSCVEGFDLTCARVYARWSCDNICQAPTNGYQESGLAVLDRDGSCRFRAQCVMMSTSCRFHALALRTAHVQPSQTAGYSEQVFLFGFKVVIVMVSADHH